MFVFILYTQVLVGVGPVLDPMNGSVVTSQERKILPSGEHFANMADVWFVELTNQWPGGGPMGLFDDIALSSHGHSWTSMRYFANGVDITDPATPGSPLIEMPFGFWDSLRYRSFWSSTPRLEWQYDRDFKSTEIRAKTGGGTAIGGGTWIPRDFMDREPATSYGATSIRRKVSRALHAEAEAKTKFGRFGIEHIAHHRQYPTLVKQKGGLLLDKANRTTALFSVSWFEESLIPLHWFGAWQGQHRSHDGAQFRHPRNATLNTTSNAFVSHVSTEFVPTKRVKIRAHVGMLSLIHI